MILGIVVILISLCPIAMAIKHFNDFVRLNLNEIKQDEYNINEKYNE